MPDLWTLHITKADGLGWGQSFEGTRKEAEACAKQLAGRGGKFSVKQCSPYKPYVPTRRHSRP